MVAESKKRAAKKSADRGARKPNTTVDKNEKVNAKGKGTRSQSNTAKTSGVGRSGAKKLAGKRTKNKSAN
ncbi:MAG: hypothetical protein K0S12_1498 [Bacteroidetes bacterium]|jgi:hypothetical protein|nr:hypothetical protein [Bacteroidota bacterium]